MAHVNLSEVVRRLSILADNCANQRPSLEDVKRRLVALGYFVDPLEPRPSVASLNNQRVTYDLMAREFALDRAIVVKLMMDWDLSSPLWYESTYIISDPHK